jgi:phosphoribosylformylglycinamidine synthase subunit PurQ / glutaminase
MDKVRALVITGSGINCEEEMAAAYRLVGAQPDIVHMSALFQEKVQIHDYDILNLPGGFSFGDDLGSAKVLSNKFKFKKMASGAHFLDELVKFLEAKKYIIGVCNGFQALVKMGLLPNTGGYFEQEATLTYNDSGKFEDRWVRLQVNPKSPTPYCKQMNYFDVPVRHGEGKLIFGDADTRRRVEEQYLNCLTYVDEQGNPADHYPFNPNGSELNCAGLCDPSGQILGLMPHPEAFLSFYNHPNWAKQKRLHTQQDEDGQGLQIFRNIVESIRQ